MKHAITARGCVHVAEHISFVYISVHDVNMHCAVVSWYGTDLKWQHFVLIGGCAPGNVKLLQELQQWV